QLGAPLVSTDVAAGAGSTLALNSAGGVLAWSSGTSGAQGAGEGSIRLWDIATARPLGAPLTGFGSIPLIVFSPDDTLATSACRTYARYGAGCTSTEIRIWDVAHRQAVGPAWS